MTQKQEKILAAALKLFASEGFAATATKKVAAEAGVSEGLIFRHFENKEGLLKAIMEEGEKRAKKYFADIVLENDPEKVIRKTIELPFNVIREEREYWKLLHRLKWQTGHYDSGKIEPLAMALANAFQKLDYAQPEAEAEYLLHHLDGLVTALLLRKDEIDEASVLSFILAKYKV